MTTYLDFLKALIALGPKFPQLLVILQEIIDKVRDALAIITEQPVLFGGLSPTSVEEAAESELVALQGGSTAVAGAPGDIITVVRGLWQFLQSNPEVMAFLLSLLKK